MSRPKKAVVEYFPHFVDHGRTMFTLENKYGNDGYAFWFKLLETLGATEQHFIDCRDVETWEFLLAKMKMDSDLVTEILNLLAKLGAIDRDLWEHKLIWSQHFVDNLSEVYRRRRINVYTKPDIEGLCIHKHPLCGVSADINPQSRVEESRVEESRVEEEDSTATEKDITKRIGEILMASGIVFPTPTEVIEIRKWMQEQSWGIEMVELAAKEMALSNTRRTDYMIKIFRRWANAGYKTAEDVAADKQQYEARQKGGQPSAKTSSSSGTIESELSKAGIDLTKHCYKPT